MYSMSLFDTPNPFLLNKLCLNQSCSYVKINIHISVRKKITVNCLSLKSKHSDILNSWYSDIHHAPTFVTYDRNLFWWCWQNWIIDIGTNILTFAFGLLIMLLINQGRYWYCYLLWILILPLILHLIYWCWLLMLPMLIPMFYLSCWCHLIRSTITKSLFVVGDQMLSVMLRHAVAYRWDHNKA